MKVRIDKGALFGRFFQNVEKVLIGNNTIFVIERNFEIPHSFAIDSETTATIVPENTVLEIGKETEGDLENSLAFDMLKVEIADGNVRTFNKSLFHADGRIVDRTEKFVSLMIQEA